MNINPFIILIDSVLSIFSFVLVVQIIISWLIGFGIINHYHPLVNRISEVLYRLTEPVLRPIRRRMPDFGGIDISPIVVFILIQFISNAMFTYFYTY